VAQTLVTDVPDVTEGFEPARLLSMRSFPHLHCELFTQLCERGSVGAMKPFEPRIVTRWEQLLDESERVTSGIVLLDLDEADRSSSLRSLGISAHRLCSLILRDLREKPAALILLTRQDYAEIEDLLLAGVAGLLHPRHDAEIMAARTQVALRRRQTAHAAQHAESDQQGHDIVAMEPKATCDIRVEAPALAATSLLLPPASGAAVAP
jgi:DNA-binding NarL/FixJ family response regulator